MVVATLLVICVSLANFDILQVRPSSISLTSIKERMGPSTEPCGTPLITFCQLDDVPFITTRCFLSESQSLKVSGGGGRGAQRSTKEDQTATVLLDLTRLSVWLNYYYNIYLIEEEEEEDYKDAVCESFISKEDYEGKVFALFGCWEE